jgi:hypothetical protein
MLLREAGPACGSSRSKHHGPTRHGTQQQQGTAGARPLGATADDRLLADERRTRVAPLLRERVALRGLGRPVGVRLPWLWHFLVACLAAWPAARPVPRPARPTAGVLSSWAAEADERGRCVQKQANQPGMGSALAAQTRQSMACHVGDRRGESGQALGATMPLVSRAQAPFHPAPYDV